MKNFLVAILTALPLVAAGACKSKSDPPKADNTERNKTTEVTADQAAQHGTALDAEQKVRKAIVADGSLSTNAHNCKVVVDKDATTVTLEGPVASADEKARLEKLAADSSGLRVVNNLEVKE
ncbi:MAG: BON domain-containing protein [Kofleriaceae bacterium]